MFRVFLDKFRLICADERGVAAYLAAAFLAIFLPLAGVAVDIGQLLVAKYQLAAAIDAAALNIAATPGITPEDAQAQAQAFVAANFTSQSKASLSALSVTQGPTTISITATTTISTALMKVIGYRTLSSTVTNQVAYAQNNLEVALVLDNTGSMSQKAGHTSKIKGLITAATELTNILFGDKATSPYVKIGVAPFAAAVNVGTSFANASWIDTGGSGSLTRENLDVPGGQGLFYLFNQLKKTSWAGCVRQRTEPYDLDDVAPTTAIPDTLFTPYFAPDEPDCCTTPNNVHSARFANSYLADQTCYGVDTTAAQKADQRCVAKYSGANPSGAGPNTSCPKKQLLRLTNVKQDILDEIEGMSPSGNTVVPAGLSWGWHLLSPNGPFADGTLYSDPSTIKAIILVTDGDNDVSGGGNGFNQSVFNAYGYGNGPHLTLKTSPNSRPQPEYNLDAKLLQLCDNIKAVTYPNGNQRIILYVIGLGSNISSHGLTLLQQCATSSQTYFANPTGDELMTTFQRIALGLNSLRVTK